MEKRSKETPPVLGAVIECARGQADRTRLDAAGRSVVVRALPEGVRYPFNYGYVEGTLVADGEEIDVFVLGDARAPGSRLDVRVVGAVAFEDWRGDDPKLLAVEVAAASGDGDGPPLSALTAAAEAVAIFLRTYKSAEEPRAVGGLIAREAALELVALARRTAADRA
jgi:inorganic pyrophosphatase